MTAGSCNRGARTLCEMLRVGPIELELKTLEVRVVGVAIPLRPAELKLLRVFLESPGRLFTRDELRATTRNVEAAMHRLRSALGVAGQAIETIPGAGYRLTSTKLPAH